MNIKHITISNATKRNWDRLNSDTKRKLQSRANKTLSKKRVIPEEYIDSNINILEIIEFLNYLLEDKNISIIDIIFSFSIKILLNKNIVYFEDKDLKVNNFHLIDILKELDGRIINEVISSKFNTSSNDFLGIIYQVLLVEGEKNKNGIYYTPSEVVKMMTDNVFIDKNTNILDPACGTGSFLLNIETNSPENLYGYDIDRIAIFITKINLVAKYHKHIFNPNVFLRNSLSDFNTIKKKFDYIITNPPWGNKQVIENNEITKVIKSRELFSSFLYVSSKLLKKKGKGIFLLPTSIINVKTHRDIREFLLNNTHVNEINFIGRKFKTVFTDVIILKFNFDKSDTIIRVKSKDKEFITDLEYSLSRKNFEFDLIEEKPRKILKKVYSFPHDFLDQSQWALGIVTGNNKKHLMQTGNDKTEHIYTGKEIQKYSLKKPNNYIIYDRSQYQQIAKEEYYRSEEKLVYKFISNNLCFAYDNNQNLFLNSANILIPVIETHNVKTVMAFLNSNLMQFIYKVKFGQIKILKGNLMLLPFPVLNTEERIELTKLVDEVITQNKDDSNIQKWIYNFYKFDEDEINLIERSM